MGRGPVGPRSPRQVSRPGCGLLLGIVFIAWMVWVVDRILPLENLGIHPRQFVGLFGIFFSPWLHGDWLHLLNNTIAFLGLGFVVLLAEGKRFLHTSFLLVLISGLGTWLIGQDGTLHIGASGLIYGYFGYLILRAWTERQPLWIVVGVLVAIVYGGMLWGVLPMEKGVSWEAHLCGFLGGLWLGRNHGLLSLAKR